MTRDYFELFDLPRILALDLKDLEKRFYALSRQLHPDVHSRKGAAERESAEEATAQLNDAYRKLREPLARAAYLLKLEGFEIGEQTTKDVPPELLEEVFELNMAMEELRSGDTGALAQNDTLPQFESARRRFESMRDEIDREMQQKFSQWDLGHDRETLVAVRGLLNRRKYISNLIAQTLNAQSSDATSHVSDRV
jgi:molecular chaperone HscB